jgi:hypothetical protein
MCKLSRVPLSQVLEENHLECDASRTLLNATRKLHIPDFNNLIVFPGSNISLWVWKGAKKEAPAEIGGNLEDNFHDLINSIDFGAQLEHACC